MRVTQLKINGIREPFGYALPSVSLSWKVTETASKKAVNTRIAVCRADAPDTPLLVKEGADLCHIGESLEVALLPRTAYIASVEVLGDAGDSAKAQLPFETGKMEEPWRAQWIAPQEGDGCHPWIQKMVAVRPGLARARLYAFGAGMFEAYINGERLGEEYFKPGITNYESRLQVYTFDAGALKEGENRLAFLLGKGWYMGAFGLENAENNFGERMAVIAELHLSYEDGTEEVVPTDQTFAYCASQIAQSGIYFGETIDGTIPFDPALPMDDPAWKPVEVLTHAGEGEPNTGIANLKTEHLSDRLSLPVRIKEYVDVKELIHTPAGETVLDFGQNFAGFPEFDAALPAGTTITLDFGEILQQGNFYRGNYREANSQFTYISGGKKETVRPTFTFFGFRYVKVTGWPGELAKETFRGCVLYSDMDRAGRIVTGNAKIDRLYANTVWGLKSNFIDMPTDCPQRNERLGWTGDAQIFAPTASYHMDTRAFFHKFETDLMDEQKFLDGAVPNYVPNFHHQTDATSAWGDIGAFLPMTLWKYYGSKEELAYAYPMMTGWVDYMDRYDAAQGERKYAFTPPFQFGDWLGLDGVSETSFKGGTDDDYLGAVYYYQSAKLTAEAAGILGKAEDAARYGKLADNIKAGILEEYFTPRGRFAMDTQASYVAALKFGLWVDKDRLVKQFRERLAKDGYRIRCGFVGAPMLCTVLAECGLIGLAYDFLLKEGFPSWLYCVNLGATTIWERWNSVGPDGTISNTGMNSLNHYSYGSVMEFVYAWAAGIRPLTPGFQKAIIDPHPDVRLPKIDCSFDSAAGAYVVNTQICADGTFTMHVEIPFGCEAEVHLPRSGKEPQMLAAGSYDFRYVPEQDFRKIYNEETPLINLSGNPVALGILFELVPPLGAFAQNQDPEFGNQTLGSFRYTTFLPITRENLEEAISRISDLVTGMSDGDAADEQSRSV